MNNSRFKISLLLFLLPFLAFADDYQSAIEIYRKEFFYSLVNSKGAPLTASDIKNIHFFEVNPAYKVIAKVTLLENETSFKMPTFDGFGKEFIRFAKLQFELDGKSLNLTLYKNLSLNNTLAYHDYLFLPFTDETNGNETYSGGRYLDIRQSDIINGVIELDFNKSYNPYCAYSDGYRCPVPPEENDLSAAIKAGEKKYAAEKRKERLAAEPLTLNAGEKQIILKPDTSALMRVIQSTVPEELSLLNAVCTNISHQDEVLPLLAKRMYLAVTDKNHPGVGIAAPQVGINRNVIWVQRLDKPGEPFELYLNPEIIWRSALVRKGAEGCLSIPDIRGDVYRNYTILLSYQDISGNSHEELIEGFTAVIFQHETDHLKGILFTERLKAQNLKSYQLINADVNLYLERLLKRQ